MKRVILIIVSCQFLILFFLPSLGKSLPIDTNIFKYFPLQVGNRWTWYIDQYWNPGPGWETVRILSSQVINNKIYFLARQENYYPYANSYYTATYYQRIDSATGNVYKYNQQTQSECLTDSLNAQRLDSAYITCEERWYISDTASYFFCGQNLIAKRFRWSNYFEAGGGRTFAFGFGRVYEIQGAHMAVTQWFLRGSLINGVLCGDTTFPVGIQTIGYEFPKDFSLYQNYPNPFNPSTKIRFSIPPLKGVGGMMVSLKIFGALGRVVATLVDEQLTPGTYEIQWDAANFPSGVYYYKLSTSYYSETKRMVLLK